MRPDTPRQHGGPGASPAERLGAIVEAAERAAQSVIDDAEAEARRYLAAAQADADRRAGGRGAELARLVDTLLADAVALRDGAERMVESLWRAREGLRAGAEPGEPDIEREPGDRGHRKGLGEEPEDVPRLAPVEQLRPRQADAPAPAPRPREQAPAGSNPNAGARLLATQLAVSGSSREEIDRRLRTGFEIEDTTAILDAILGPEE